MSPVESVPVQAVQSLKVPMLVGAVDAGAAAGLVVAATAEESAESASPPAISAASSHRGIDFMGKPSCFRRPVK